MKTDNKYKKQNFVEKNYYIKTLIENFITQYVI
jgi:hypothetical protein